MANVERLTKRVKKVEEWIEENEDMGGPAGTLDTFNFLINETKASNMRYYQMEQHFKRLKGFLEEFLGLDNKNLLDEWNEFLEEKDKESLQEQVVETSDEEKEE
jgi:hypothetical protein